MAFDFSLGSQVTETLDLNFNSLYMFEYRTNEQYICSNMA